MVMMLMPCAYAMRTPTPIKITDYDDKNIVSINSNFKNLWDITNGRYNYDVETTVPSASADEGDMKLYQSGTTRRIYFYVDGGWRYIQEGAGALGDDVAVDGVDIVNPNFVDDGDIGFTDNGGTVEGYIQDGKVQDDEIDYTAVTLADFTNDAGFITSGNTIYIEEGDVARVDSSGADLYVDFDNGDFDVGTVGNEANITLQEAIDAVEIANTAGDFKIEPDAEGDVYFFGDTDVATAGTDGKAVYFYRKAAEGDEYVSIKTDQYQKSLIYCDNKLDIRSSSNMDIRTNSNDLSLQSEAVADVNIFESIDDGENPALFLYGWASSAGGRKYVTMKVDDSNSDRFTIAREDFYIPAAEIKLPLVVSDVSGEMVEVDRGTTDTDITFIKLYNADGEACYIYPNADQNAIVVQAAKP